MIEWETEAVSIMESSQRTPLCASVINPKIDIPATVQLPVRSMAVTANGITMRILINA